jgi:hypothetical protein
MGRKWKLAIIASLFGSLVIYTELLSGMLKRRSWPEFKNGMSNSKLEKDEVLRILLVADPQLIGEENEGRFIGLFSRWDSDNYLHRNYKLARDHVMPHIVAFLGDIFDEGIQAQDIQYRRYAKRFTDIFEIPSKSDPSDIEYIFLPGDNDVGGEHEAISPVKLKWFNLTFGDFEDPFLLRRGGWNIQFLKIWSMAFASNDAHQRFIEKVNSLTQDKSNGLRIILSHMPFWRYTSKAFRKMVTELNPALIISGNDHRSSLIVFNEDDSYQYQRTTSFQLAPNTETHERKAFHRMNLGKISDKIALKEIGVPTCSYRMGVSDMGFGALKLYKNGTMDYTVLWAPSRFHQLKLYLGLYILWKLVFTPWLLWKLYWFLLQKYRNSKKTRQG